MAGARCTLCNYYPPAPPNHHGGRPPKRCVGCRGLDARPRSWAAYAACDWCGVDAKVPCIEDDDITNKTAPCASRALVGVVLPMPPQPKRAPQPKPDGAPVAEVQCYWCRCTLPVKRGRSASARAPCCGSAECERGRNADHMRRSRQRP